MNRLLLFSIFLIALASCDQKQSRKRKVLPKDVALIKITQGGDNKGSCVQISRKLEKDPRYNKLLATYAGYCFCRSSDSALTPSTLKDLAARPSFKKMILLFYTNSDSDKIYNNRGRSVINDMRSELLYGIKDYCPEELTHISNILLQKNNFDGVEALWEKTDVKKLPALSTYVRRVDTGNFFIYADLAAVFHNSRNYPLRDFYLVKAGRCRDFQQEYGALKSLISKRKQFDVTEFKESIYGGM